MISIISAVYNHEEYLEQAIESVLSQTYKDWELILWDDGSSDQSLEIAKKYAKLHPNKIYSYTHKNNQNFGQEFTRNEAIKSSKGEFISLLDSDDYYYPEKLEKLLPILTTDEAVGMSYGVGDIFDSNTKIIKHSEIYNLPSGNIFNSLIYDNFIFAGATLFRRKFFDDGLVFESEYKTCGEYPLWLKIAERSQVVFVPFPVCVWRNHSKNLGKKSELNAKKELVLMKENFLKNNSIPAYEECLRKGLKKSEYDYASLCFTEHKFEEAKIYYKKIIATSKSNDEFNIKAKIFLKICELPTLIKNQVVFVKQRYRNLFKNG